MVVIVTAATADVFDVQVETNGPSPGSFLVTRITKTEIIIQPAITINKVIKRILFDEFSILKSI